MGILDRIERAIGGGLAAATDTFSSIYHTVTGTPTADDIRNQRYAINDQIKAYKEQTALSEKAINEAREQQLVEKRKINEKQIRSLRNNYRSAGGFLNSESGDAGPSGNLTNKLGG